jgi:hypothetical protein
MDSRDPSPWAGVWYFLVTIFSFGLLAWVPFVHAAGRLRRRSVVVMAVVYAVGAVTSVVLTSLGPTDAQGGDGEGYVTVAILLMLSMVVIGCVHQAWLRRQVYHAATGTPDPVLAAALQARDRRVAARKLATDDPVIAHDLRIGRPDLPRQYDDGGLVDLNSAPAAVIATTCGLSPAAADSIVAARARCGGFLTVDDLFSLADVPVGAWDTVRDRGLVIPLAS